MIMTIVLPSTAAPGPQSAGGDDSVRLTGADCWRLLGRGGTGRLVVDDGVDGECVPVSYVAHAGCLYLRAAAASLPQLTPQSRVTLTRDGDSGSAPWTVVAHGLARRLISDQDVSRAGVQHLTDWQNKDKDDYVELRPDRITGRRGPGPTTGPSALMDLDGRDDNRVHDRAVARHLPRPAVA